MRAGSHRAHATSVKESGASWGTLCCPTAVRYQDKISRFRIPPGAGRCPAWCGQSVEEVPRWQRHRCHLPTLWFHWRKSNWITMDHYVSVHPSTTTDCPGAHWCPDPSLGGDHPPPHQEHAQVSGVLTGTQTLLGLIMSCWDKNLDQPVISLFFFFDFQCDFERSPKRVQILLSTDWFFSTWIILFIKTW